MTGTVSDIKMTGNDGLVAALTAVVYAGFLWTAFMTDSPAVDGTAGTGLVEALSPTSTGFVGASQLSPGGGAGIEAAAQVMEFIVKFDEGQARRLRDLYIDSPKQAREAFGQLADEHEGFRDLRLQSITIGGFGTLVFDGEAPTDANERETVADDILVRLNAAPGVEYAEPNLVAVRDGVEP